MQTERIQYVKPTYGKTPSVILVDPKYPHNVGAAVRAASCYGIKQVWFTGRRVRDELSAKRRLPREERMKGYGDVELINTDFPFDAFPPGTAHIAVELRQGFVPLPMITHPVNATYVFGPEDGSIPSPILSLCHYFVIIPSRHCLNLAASVYTVLYDRATKRWQEGDEELLALSEQRGFYCDLEKEEI